MNDRQTTLQEIKEKVREFREERGWLETDPKDIALSLVLEAGEVLEQFQWVTSEEVIDKPEWRMAVGEEVADVLFLLTELSSILDVDVAEAFEKKIEKQAKKYPLTEFGVDKSRDEQMKAYYRIKAKTRGGHPLAEDK
jgi:NTP pyrophosphatase (non-canonical NTP hydrolase)